MVGHTMAEREQLGANPGLQTSQLLEEACCRCLVAFTVSQGRMGKFPHAGPAALTRALPQ